MICSEDGILAVVEQGMEFLLQLLLSNQLLWIKSFVLISFANRRNGSFVFGEIEICFQKN
jgi:hypothetical protein